MMPNFLIIGAAKSGTTALWSFVRQHPDVFMPDFKEPHYFAFSEGERPRYAGPGASIGNAITSRRRYEGLFAGAGSARAVGEASNLYIYLPGAAERISLLLPNARMVAILRQPADRAFSSYLHLKRQGREPAPSFEAALALEDERITAGWGFLWRYRDLGFYGRQLQAYLRLFRREQILVHLYDELLADPAAVLRRTFEFLGVDPGYRPDVARHRNRGGVPRSDWRGRLLSRRNPLRSAAARVLPRGVRDRVRGAVDEQALQRVTIDPATRRRLTDEFSGDIRELGAMLHRDLSGWL